MQLKTRDLSFSYDPQKTSTMSFVDLEFTQGKVYGIFGPNGCGKSTYLKCLSSLYRPLSGSIYLDDQDVKTCLARYRGEVLYLEGGPQGLYPRLNATENLQFFAGLRKEMLSHSDAIVALGDWGLSADDAVKQVVKFSLGMKQRLHLARLSTENANIYFLDEPTNGLDTNGVSLASTMIKKIAKEKNAIIVLVSHDANFLNETSDLVLNFQRQILKAVI